MTQPGLGTLGVYLGNQPNKELDKLPTSRARFGGLTDSVTNASTVIL